MNPITVALSQNKSLIQRFSGACIHAKITGLLCIFPWMIHANLLPNPGFEWGGNEVEGWRLSEGTGERVAQAYQGKYAVMVQGNSSNQSTWRTDLPTLEPNQTYRLRFWARKDAACTGGCVVAGINGINRDFSPTDSWQQYSYIFRTPSQLSTAHVRLGQWHANGRIYFDEVSLNQVFPVDKTVMPQLALATGESIKKNLYRFDMPLHYEGANHHRTLSNNNAQFNSDRWVFSPQSSVTYHFGFAQFPFLSGRVQTAINYYDGGELTIESSRDNKQWHRTDILSDKTRNSAISLPQEWFPLTNLWIRLTHTGKSGNFQVNQCRFEASLDQKPPTVVGSTHFLEMQHLAPGWKIASCLLDGPNEAGKGSLNLMLSASNKEEIVLRPWLQADNKKFFIESFMTLKPGVSSQVSIPFQLTRPGSQAITFGIDDNQNRPHFACSMELRLGFLNDPTYGYALPMKPELGLWWCESGHKVGLERNPPAPSKDSNAVKLTAAGNEHEAVQIILHPKQEGQLISIKTDPFSDAQGKAWELPTLIFEVTYVEVTQPTDSLGYAGWFPDPLPSLRLPKSWKTGQNLPLWLSVYIPTDTPQGKYQSTLQMETSLGLVAIPLEVQVYGFNLPKETHLRSALGISPQNIYQYHQATNKTEQARIYDKYLQNFADHRISPYTFFANAPIKIRFSGEGTNKHPEIDFTDFDIAARKWLTTQKFNSFSLPLRGMGGGTFHSRHLGELEGFKEGMPEHSRLFKEYLSQIERHLHEKGWLSYAYTYWFDEPDPKDYAFVIDGMKRLKEAAPGIKRLLTEQPESELLSHVEIWCGLTPEWTKHRVAQRRNAGEEVWWYVCTGPKSPYITLFIDHPGNIMRLWPWQSWQFGITGILVWETTYWTSDLVYPSPKQQDPWQDPMSYVTGYGNPVGHIGYWGNGDGRFVYPPRTSHQQESMQGAQNEPVNSIRWENLRDGMEDYEYFWLLDHLIKFPNKLPSELVNQARQLLEVPSAISQDLTHYNADPQLLLKHRQEMALMIERMMKMQ